MKSGEEFAKAWWKSHGWAFVAAAWLQGRGEHVRAVPSELRPDENNRWKYTDGGDLELTRVVQVKHRENLDFSDSETYQYDTVFVDEVYKIDKQEKPVAFYMIISRDGSACAIIPDHTKSKWVVVKEKWDKKQQRVCDFYACPKHLVAFHSME